MRFTGRSPKASVGSRPEHAGPGVDGDGHPPRRGPERRARLHALLSAVTDADPDALQRQIRELLQSHRALAPLTITVGALLLLLQGFRVVLSNWRLAVLQILPAMWIWAAMTDLRAQFFNGPSFRVLTSLPDITAMVTVVALTVATYHLSAVYALAITAPPAEASVRAAFRAARRYRVTTAAWGATIGAALAAAVVIAPRYGTHWFVLSLGTVVAVMMLTYVTVPARTVGVIGSRTVPRRDALASTAIASVLGAVVCSPAYLLGRIGVLLLGAGALGVLGVIFLVAGFIFQAGAYGAVKAIKVSSQILSRR